MKTGMKLLIFSTILLSSCGSTTSYRPSIYGHDYINREIVKPVTHERISCGENDFNRFVSIDLDDLRKLALVLKNAKVPRKVRILIEGFEKEVNRKRKLQGVDDEN